MIREEVVSFPLLLYSDLKINFPIKDQIDFPYSWSNPLFHCSIIFHYISLIKGCNILANIQSPVKCEKLKKGHFSPILKGSMRTTRNEIKLDSGRSLTKVVLNHTPNLNQLNTATKMWQT